MTTLRITPLFNIANTEEEVKFYFASTLNIKPDTSNNIDLYTPQILFEFKLDANLENPKIRAKCFAQALYYVRNLKFGLKGETRPPTNFVSVVTKNFAAILPTATFDDICSNKSFNWRRQPSYPCPNLISALTDFKPLRECIVYDFSDDASHDAFFDKTKSILKSSLPPDSKIIINENNFLQIFKTWEHKFGNLLDADRKLSEYFITDIERGKSNLISASTLRFNMTDGSVVDKLFPRPIKYAYSGFWSNYQRISDPRRIIAIRQKMDCMTNEDLRRRTGEFYTPGNFAEAAVDYLFSTIDFDDPNLRLWDMAAGSGNLINAIAGKIDLRKCYVSTLLADDAAYCQTIFPAATCFQYDYLNDDVDALISPAAANSLKMPANLAADLANPRIKWIIFINPPYATANNYERDKSRLDKDEVSFTAIQQLMTEAGMGEVSRELFSQFLYRISIEFKDRKAWLGIFSKLKYINANNDQTLRDNFFHYKFESGFVMSSQNFYGCKGSFPVGFLIWNLAENIPLENQTIALDVLDSEACAVAVKNIHAANRADFLNKWIKRPTGTKKFPPLSSGLILGKSKTRRDKITDDFLAGFMCTGNDFMHRNYTALLSGPYVGFGSMLVTPENFEQCMVVHMVRRLPKATWLNDRDQFMQPRVELGAEFIADAVVWSMFAASNQTVSLRDVEYEGAVYQMPNNLYPWGLAEIAGWKMPAAVREQLASAEDRFAALWLLEHAGAVSAEALAVLAEAKRIYQVFYEHWNIWADSRLWKIENWDVGWYQIRMALKESPYEAGAHFKAAYEKLSAKLLPQIYALGFLRDEVRYFEEE